MTKISLSAIYSYVFDSGCQICCNWSRLKPGFLVASTMKNHAIDKHDTPPSHFILMQNNLSFIHSSKG